jgi:hypothetical protein
MGKIRVALSYLPNGQVVARGYDVVSDSFVGEWVGDTVDDAKDAAVDALEAIGDEVVDIAHAIANATLDVVRGLGGAIVDGLDSAYDAARGKLEGKEADVIAGIVVVALTVLTVTYIFHSAKVAGDAF